MAKTFQASSNAKQTAGFGKALAALAVLLSSAAPANAWEVEVGRVESNNSFRTSPVKHITFQEPFTSTPVVVVMSARTGGDPMAPRVFNITETGFDLVVLEPSGSDGKHGAVEVDYVAIEKGVHLLPGGERIAVGTIDITAQQISHQTGQSSDWDTLALRTSLESKAAILTALQTHNNNPLSETTEPAAPWLTTVTRWHGRSSAHIALERSEVAAGALEKPETVGFIAFPSGGAGTFTANDGELVEWRAMLSPEMFIGTWQDCKSIPFAPASFDNPHAVASKSSRRGNDGGWMQRCSLEHGRLGLQVDEDIAMDNERVHIDEQASILVFSRPFHADFADRIDEAQLVIARSQID